MAKTIQVSVDTSDLKVLNTHLNTTKKTIQMTAKSAKSDFKQLKMSIDPVYRAEKVFTQQVLVAQKAVSTGAISNAEYSRTFAMIQKNAQASGMTLNQFGQVANVNTRKMKRFGAVGMQQVGYQVQDFAVQVQGGTSAMVALGQQGSQLLGIFGPAGAIAGMILAIGTGLAGAFMAAKSAGDESVSSMELYKTAMEDTTEAVKTLRQENYMLAQGIQYASLAKAKQALDEIKYNNEVRRAALSDEIAERMMSGKQTDNHERRLAKLDDKKQGFAGVFGKSYNEMVAEIEAQIAKLNVELEKNEALKLKKKTKEDLVKQNQEQDEFLKKLEVQYGHARRISHANKEDLFATKQINEMVEFKIHLEKLGLKEGSKKYEQAMLIKDLEQTALANVYYREEAERRLAESKRKAAQAERDRLKAAREAHEAAKLAAADLIALNKSIGNSMENAMMSMVDGTKSVKDAFKDMAREIIKELYRIYVVKKITGMITGAIQDKFAPDVGATASAITDNLANGGPVSAGGKYIVGERGPEVFTPTMGGHITPNSGGGGGSGTTIVQNINVSTGVQQTVRSEIRQMMPQIADSAKGAVLNAKRRGGNYGRAMA